MIGLPDGGKVIT